MEKIMSNHLEKRLARFKEQLKKIEHNVQNAEAKIKIRDQKNRDRKKFLVGDYYLEMAEKNNTMEEIKALMDTHLKKDSDRKLFGLKPLPNTK